MNHNHNWLFRCHFSKFTKIEYSNHILWRNIYFLLTLSVQPNYKLLLPNSCDHAAPPVNLLSTFRGRRSAVGISPTFSRCVFFHNSHKCVSRGRFRFYYARDCMEDINFFFEALKGFTTMMCSYSFNCPRMWLSLWFGEEFSSVRSSPDWMSLGEKFRQIDSEAAVFPARFFLPVQPLTLHTR